MAIGINVTSHEYSKLDFIEQCLFICKEYMRIKLLKGICYWQSLYNLLIHEKTLNFMIHNK